MLALQHQRIPAHLHFHNPNPLIPWSDLPVRVADRSMPFAPLRGKRIAGLSSFGFSGTNAHVLIEESPPLDAQADPGSRRERPLQLFTLAARSEQPLCELAGLYQAHFLANPRQPLADVAYSANTGRSPRETRLTVIAQNTAEVGAALAAFVEGKPNAKLTAAVLDHQEPPRIAFLFTGQGVPFAGMARQIYDGEPVFRAAFEKCDGLFTPYLSGSLIDLLYGESSKEGAAQRQWNDSKWADAARFALDWALLSLWRSWGIEPALVMGQGVGEIVAACASGVCSLEHAAKMVAARSRLMEQLPRDTTKPGWMWWAAPWPDARRISNRLRIGTLWRIPQSRSSQA